MEHISDVTTYLAKYGPALAGRIAERFKPLRRSRRRTSGVRMTKHAERNGGVSARTPLRLSYPVWPAPTPPQEVLLKLRLQDGPYGLPLRNPSERRPHRRRIVIVGIAFEFDRYLL